MKESPPIKIFLVDDDAVYLKSLEIEFHQETAFHIETFSTGEQCLENIAKRPDIIVLDYHLNGTVKTAMNGIETLDKIKALDETIPVIILSSQDKIEVAVDCMHHLAADYIVKSETAFVRLQKKIQGILRFRDIERRLNWYIDRM